MDSVVHFEIPAENLERAKRFYKGIFGWEITPAPGTEPAYQMVTTAESDKNGPKEPGSINGGLMERSHAGEGPVIVINVKNLEASIKQIEAAGGKTLMPVQKVMDMGLYNDHGFANASH